MKSSNELTSEDYLAQNFPDAFTNPPRPLAVGIYGRICERLFEGVPGDHSSPEIWQEGRALSLALCRWTSQTAYLAALTEGATRFDMCGNPAGLVTPEEAARARRQLAALSESG